jgi:aminobenzoyl-glutamate utilization protein B
MAREGVFDDLDAAFAWHPMTVNAVWDISSLANFQVLYKFRGRASHAAGSPHAGRSALDAVELMNVGVNFLREHVIQEARIHYAITNAGGFSPNVVQADADVLYLIRAPQTPQVEEIYGRVNKIAQGAALMTETEVEIQFIKACANIVPNKTLSKVLYENFAEQEMPNWTEEERRFAEDVAKTAERHLDDLDRFLTRNPSDLRKYTRLLEGKSLCDLLLPFYENGPDGLGSGSSDVGDVSWNVPTAQIVTACYSLTAPGHSWQRVSQSRTSLAHKGMLLAAKVMAGGAVDVLHSPEVLEKAKIELRERLEGAPYRCAIPPEVKPRPIGRISSS